MIDDVARIVGERWVLSGGGIPDQYISDATFVTARPDMVVLPADAEQTAAVVGLLYERGVPIVSRGAGTGLSGGAVALTGGAVLSLERLSWVDIDEANMVAEAGAGTITAELHSAASALGLMYPPDPGSVDTCTIGGNIATNAGGPACVKYGVTAEYVLALQVVTHQGELVWVGGRTRKRASGYRLAQLFVGSEGTLGPVTAAALRLIPQPRAVATVIASFADATAAGRCVRAVMGSGIVPSACELIDRSSLDLVADLLPDPSFVGGTILLFETDGEEAGSVQAQAEAIAGIAMEHGGLRSLVGFDETSRGQMWLARRSIGKRLVAKKHHRLPEDLCVPLDRIPQMIDRVEKICAEEGVAYVLFGHAGDGNLHPSLLFESREPDELAKVERAAMKIFSTAQELGGTISAEHGLGATKSAMAASDIPAASLAMMGSIKRTIDPKGLFNPGKVFPPLVAQGLLSHLPGWS